MNLDDASRWRDLWKRAAKRKWMQHKNALASLAHNLRQKEALLQSTKELAEENNTLRAEKAMLQAKIDVLVESVKLQVRHIDEY